MAGRIAGIILAGICSAWAAGGDGGEIGKESAVRGSVFGRDKAFEKVKVQNNLCWELVDVRPGGRADDAYVFSLPVDRWVFMRSEAEIGRDGGVRVTVDSEREAAIVHSKSGTLEAMRYLKKGSHTVRLRDEGRGRVTRLVVRAIPALQYAYYGGEYSAIRPHGPYDWEFLKRDVLPNVNVMINNRHVAPNPEHIKAWKASGRHWIWDRHALWDTQGDENSEVERTYAFWSASPGYTHPLGDGILVDEIGKSNPFFEVQRKAIERLYETPAFGGRTFSTYSYGDALYTNDRGKELARSVTGRCANGPNAFRQQIRNLTPGRLYSMKVLSSDYRDLMEGKSDKKQNAVSIKIENVELLTGPKNSFQFSYPHGYGSKKVDKFDLKHQYWVNYHWRVFRAEGTTARLTVTDWANEREPGGPVGQELMFNFIEIQPYN